MKNTEYQNLQAAAQAALRGKFIVLIPILHEVLEPQDRSGNAVFENTGPRIF